MKTFSHENDAFAAAQSRLASLARAGRENIGLRVIKTKNGYKVLMVPNRVDGGNPFYLGEES